MQPLVAVKNGKLSKIARNIPVDAAIVIDAYGNIPLYYTYCNFILKPDRIGQAIFISDMFCFPQHIG